MASDALETTLMIAGPLLLVSLVVGLLVSVVQVITSIHDMTMSFVPRMIAVFLAFLLLLPWTMRVLIGYSVELLGHLERFAL
ncbi:MAG: EscS/YscS/HrcS family type III secretion system export apparatus protein [Acidobacteria bacterium]|nr:EscS/YscS/HrcS family type III secretion system export apparatus protein [Acidobacteriota bacterium]